MAEMVRAHPEGAVLAVKVAAGSSQQRICGRLGDRLKVAVRAPARRGAANEAVCALVAGALGLRLADVQVLRGHARPQKELLVCGLAPAEVLVRLSR